MMECSPLASLSIRSLSRYTYSLYELLAQNIAIERKPQMTYDELQQKMEAGFSRAEIKVSQPKFEWNGRITVTPYTSTPSNWSGYQIEFWFEDYSDPYTSDELTFYVSTIADVMFNIVQFQMGEPENWIVTP